MRENCFMRETKLIALFRSALLLFTALALIAATTVPRSIPDTSSCQMQVKFSPTLEYGCFGADCSLLSPCPLHDAGFAPHADTTTVPGHTLYFCNCLGGTIWCAGVANSTYWCQAYIDKVGETQTAKCMDCGCSLQVNPPNANSCIVDGSLPAGSFQLICKCPPPPHE